MELAEQELVAVSSVEAEQRVVIDCSAVQVSHMAGVAGVVVFVSMVVVFASDVAYAAVRAIVGTGGVVADAADAAAPAGGGVVVGAASDEASAAASEDSGHQTAAVAVSTASDTPAAAEPVTEGIAAAFAAVGGVGI